VPHSSSGFLLDEWAATNPNHRTSFLSSVAEEPRIHTIRKGPLQLNGSGPFRFANAT
jgi:hypothetical protein